MPRAEQPRVLVLDDAASVGRALSPVRREILEELAEPDSAAGLAARLRLPRQKVNYHLRVLEKAGLLELVEERQKRGFHARILRTSANAFVVDPSLLGAWIGNVEGLPDRFSSAYLITTGARLVKDVATLREEADRAGKKLLTATLETEASFETPGKFDAFTRELAKEIARLTRKHGARRGRKGRRVRLLVAAHPTTRGNAK